MLTAEMNERLTRVGPGTPMGELLRRYWLPALLSWELKPDGTPVRQTLLGENLVAFRDTSGRVGLFTEQCPHRGASLWLGRNEENGLRCVYHGWKFDVTGQCVDQMNEPEEYEFSKKVRVQAYATVEQGGVIWAYMGPADKQPPPPNFEFTQVPDGKHNATKVRQECNWLQALEGGIDTSHAPILHRALKSNPKQPGIDPDSPFVQGKAPTIEIEVTDYGYRYFGIRKLGEDQQYVRGYHYVMPFTQMRPAGLEGNQVHGHWWVPIDDENSMVWNWYYAFDGAELSPESWDPQGAGNSFTTDIDVNNGFRSYKNVFNDWLIDREMQKTETFTGIQGANTQDRATQETMGRIMDRRREHLGQADRAIIAARKLLEEAVDTVENGGTPRGVSGTYYELRSAERVLPAEADWREELYPLMYPVSGGNGP
jgi:phenylpropionate dioxygenase-like ring-hydroxylating dioxygenase large terminal subunit